MLKLGLTNSQKHGVWNQLRFSFNGRTAAQCFLKGLYCDPDPFSANWDKIALPTDSPDCRALQAEFDAFKKLSLLERKNWDKTSLSTLCLERKH